MSAASSRSPTTVRHGDGTFDASSHRDVHVVCLHVRDVRLVAPNYPLGQALGGRLPCVRLRSLQFQRAEADQGSRQLLLVQVVLLGRFLARFHNTSRATGHSKPIRSSSALLAGASLGRNHSDQLEAQRLHDTDFLSKRSSAQSQVKAVASTSALPFGNPRQSIAPTGFDSFLVANFKCLTAVATSSESASVQIHQNSSAQRDLLGFIHMDTCSRRLPTRTSNCLLKFRIAQQ